MVYLIRYGELALKGKNRSVFERKLVKNIESFLNKNNILYNNITRVRGRIILKTDKDCSGIRNIFGITSFSKAIKTEADLEMMKEEALNIARLSNFRTFKVNAKRLTKEFELDSMQININIGAFLVEETHAKVKMVDPDLEIGIELINGKSYLFSKKEKGFGGLPLGIEGTVLAIIEGKPSLLAAWLVMKRGCAVVPLSKDGEDISLIRKYDYGAKKEAETLPHIDILAEKHNAKAIVVADTLDSIKEYETKLPILRPIITYTKEDIDKQYIEIK